MPDKITLPDYLPDSVEMNAHQILSGPHSPETGQVVRSLCLDERMCSVWATLAKQKTQPKGLSNIVSSVLSALNYWDFMGEAGLLLTPKEIGARISETLAVMDEAEQLFKKNHLLIYDYQPECLNPVQIEFNKIRKAIKNYSMFWPTLPTKINAAKARKTFLLRSLKADVLHMYGKPLHDVVATVASVVLEDENIYEDDVRKA